MKRVVCPTLVALSLTLPAAALASPVLTFNEATGSNGLNQDQSVGWQFNVLSPISVTGLGWFDEGANGLVMGHQVGLWSPSGALLASANVPSGTSVPLEGQFRTGSITPLLLSPGMGYIVGGLNFLTNTERLAANVTITTDPSIAFVDATFSDIGSGFTRPTMFSSAATGFFGPSFSVQSVSAAVPEPSSMLLLVTGLLGAGAHYWPRRRHQKKITR